MTDEPVRTPVIDLLEKNGIDFRVLPHTQPALTCEAAALARDVPLGQMVKCLFLLDKTGRAFLACVPGDARLSMARFKKASGVKSFATVSDEDILLHTGFCRGSIPPLCLPARLTVIADEAICRLSRVNISAGDPMAGVELASADFARVFGGTFASITE